MRDRNIKKKMKTEGKKKNGNGNGANGNGNGNGGSDGGSNGGGVSEKDHGAQSIKSPSIAIIQKDSPREHTDAAAG